MTPTGRCWPVSRRTWVAGAVCSFAAGALFTAGTGHTFASFSDSVTLKGNTAKASVWGSPHPTPPPECGPLSRYWKVVYGTSGDDHFVGGSRPEIFMGLGGHDTFVGGTKGDCMVDGGDGGHSHFTCGTNDDVLYGHDGDRYRDGDAEYDWSSKNFDSYRCCDHSDADDGDDGGHTHHHHSSYTFVISDQ